MRKIIERDEVRLDFPDGDITVQLDGIEVTPADANKMKETRYIINLTFWDDDRNPTSVHLNLAQWTAIQSVIGQELSKLGHNLNEK